MSYIAKKKPSPVQARQRKVFCGYSEARTPGYMGKGSLDVSGHNFSQYSCVKDKFRDYLESSDKEISI